MEQKLISIREILKQGWQLYRGNFSKFIIPLVIMAIPSVAILLLEFINNFILQQVLTIIIGIASLIVSLWISVLLIDLISRIIDKKPANPDELYQSSLAKIASYFWVNIIVGFFVIIGLILFIIPGIIFSIWYAFAEFINVVEEKNNKGYAALKSSKELVKGRWGSTFWRLLIPTLIVFLIIGAIMAAIIIPIALSGSFDTLNPLLGIIANLIFIILSFLITPLTLTFALLVYKSLKATKKEIIG